MTRRQQSGDRTRAGRPGGVTVDGVLLQNKRRYHGLTMGDLGKRLGVSAAAGGRCEDGRTPEERGNRKSKEVSAKTLQRAEQGGPISRAIAVRLADWFHIPHEDFIIDVPDRLQKGGLAVSELHREPIGRDAEMKTIIGWLASSQPLACITGPNGIGKSILAGAVASQFSQRLDGRVAWVSAWENGKQANAREIQTRIAWAFGFQSRLPRPASDDGHGFHSSFIAELERSRGLVVLDDVVNGYFADKFMRDGSAARLLVTTHTRSVAERFDSHALALEPVGVDATRRLFVGQLKPGSERARQVEGDIDGFEALCSVLGGIPRCIQIAAAIFQRKHFVTNLSEFAQQLRGSLETMEPGPALRDPSNSLLAELSRIGKRVNERAWELLPNLAVFGSAPFPAEWAMAAGGLVSTQEAINLLSELNEFYIIEGADGRTGGASCRLRSYVVGYARSQLGDRRPEVLARVARHLADTDAPGPRAAGSAPPHSRDFPEYLEALNHALSEIGALLFGDRTSRDHREPFVGELTSRALAEDLVIIAGRLVPWFEHLGMHGAASWVHAAIACADGLGRPADAALLLIALGRSWLHEHVDLATPIAWFEAAEARFAATERFAEAAAAASESGRAMLGSQQSDSGIERFDRVIGYASRASLDGVELACRLSSAAASITRRANRDEWKRAAELLERAVTACDTDSGADEHDRVLIHVVSSCNQAAVQFVLSGGERRPDLVDAVTKALAAWRERSLATPMLDARLRLLVRVLDVPDEPLVADGVGGKKWRSALSARVQEPEGLLWQIGEAALYLRRFLEYIRQPDRSDRSDHAVIASGFGLSDVSREVHPRRRDLVPLGLLFPIPPLVDVFDPDYIARASALAADKYGEENRVLAELDAVKRELASLTAVDRAWIAPPWQRVFSRSP